MIWGLFTWIRSAISIGKCWGVAFSSSFKNHRFFQIEIFFSFLVNPKINLAFKSHLLVWLPCTVYSSQFELWSLPGLLKLNSFDFESITTAVRKVASISLFSRWKQNSKNFFFQKYFLTRVTSSISISKKAKGAFVGISLTDFSQGNWWLKWFFFQFSIRSFDIFHPHRSVVQPCTQWRNNFVEVNVSFT